MRPSVGEDLAQGGGEYGGMGEPDAFASVMIVPF
jgi:hypothetical protein